VSVEEAVTARVLRLAAVEESGSEEDNGDHEREAGVQHVVHAEANQGIGEPRQEACEPDPCCLSHH